MIAKVSSLLKKTHQKHYKNRPHRFRNRSGIYILLPYLIRILIQDVIPTITCGKFHISHGQKGAQNNSAVDDKKFITFPTRNLVNSSILYICESRSTLLKLVDYQEFEIATEKRKRLKYEQLQESGKFYSIHILTSSILVIVCVKLSTLRYVFAD